MARPLRERDSVYFKMNSARITLGKATQALVQRFAIVTMSALLFACQSGAPTAPETGSAGEIVARTSALAQTASALDPSAPHWTKGDSWEFSDGYGLRVDAAGKDSTLFMRTDIEETWTRREGIFPIESVSDSTHRKVVFRDRDPREIFPLSVGNQTVFKREYLSNKKLLVHRTSWIVEKRERLRVPAGEFETWVLVRRTRNERSDWTGYERWWYSPRARMYVRLEYRYGDGKLGSRVLTKYSVSAG